MAKLAINGGKPAVEEKLIPYPQVTEDDKSAVMRVLERGKLWGLESPEAKGLEKDWADYVGTKYCLTTNSGTAALHCAIHALGIKPGDEVITSAYTFLASASAALHHNAIPLFVDILPDTHQLDCRQIEDRISPNTRAIIPVHIEGLPCDIDKVKEIADKHGLKVIEDAAQAHGAIFKGRKAGTFGDMSIFSLNDTKNLAGAEGGLLNTESEEYRDRAQMLRMFGEVPPKEGERRKYNAFGMGWQYRNNEMCAAIARSRLNRLDQENEGRKRNVAYLESKMADLQALIFPTVPEDRTHVYYLYRIKIDPSRIGLDVDPRKFRIQLQRALLAEGVQADEWQDMPVPGQTLFQAREGYGYGYPWTDQHARQGIKYDLADYPETTRLLDTSFVIHSALVPPNGNKLMSDYVNAFQKCFENIDEVLGIDTDVPLPPIHGRR